MTTPEQPDLDAAFAQAVSAWRERHKLREDDAVVLLVELFHIHQQHWDQLRRRDLPSFELVQAEVVKLTDLAQTLHSQIADLSETLRKLPSPRSPALVTRSTAFYATIAGLLAGYLFGRAWP